MNWDERYRKEAGLADFYMNHIVPIERAVWPDPGAVIHDVMWSVKRMIPGTPEHARAQATMSLIKGLPQTVVTKVKGPRESNLEEAGSEPQ